jgi:hypothetical protein
LRTPIVLLRAIGLILQPTGYEMQMMCLVHGLQSASRFGPTREALKCEQGRPFGTFVAKCGEQEARGLSRIEQKPEPGSVRHDGQAMEKPRFGDIQRQ